MSKINLLDLLEAYFTEQGTSKKAQLAIRKSTALPTLQKVLDKHLEGRADGIQKLTEAIEDITYILPLEEAKTATAFFDMHPSGMRLIVTKTLNGATYQREALDPSEKIEIPAQQKEPVADAAPQEQKISAPAKPAAPLRNLSKFHVLVPAHKPIPPQAMFSIMAQWKATVPQEAAQHLAKFNVQQDTLIHHARNILAQQFLQSDKEWSFWMDGDMLVPNGNPAWFKMWTGATMSDAFASAVAIDILTSHKDKTIVSAIYCQRNRTHRLVAPDSIIAEHGEQIKVGPRKTLLQSPWVPFGCVAVHRSVFEDIMKSHPELAPQKPEDPFNFFGATQEITSEDVIFCKRAKDAGHAAWFDLGIHCGHIGNYAFMP